jgi:hypothetical protein
MLTGLGLVELGLGKPESGCEAFRRDWICWKRR